MQLRDFLEATAAADQQTVALMLAPMQKKTSPDRFHVLHIAPSSLILCVNSSSPECIIWTCD